MSTGSSSGNHDPRHGSWTVSIEMPSPTALQLATSNNMNNISATSEFDSNALVQNHQRRGKGLRAPICLKLTIFVGLLVLLASGVPGIFLLLKAHNQLVDEIERRLITVSTLRQEQLREYLLSETEKTELIANRVMINKYLMDTSKVDKSFVYYDLATATSVISDFLHSGIYDREGKLLISTHQSIFSATLERDELTKIYEDRFKLSHPFKNDQFGWTYQITRTILQEKNRVIGVLVTFVNATNLAKLYYGRTGLQKTGEVLIGIPEGTDMVRFLFPPAQNRNMTLFSKSGAMERALNGEIGVMVFRDYNGAKVVAAYRPVGFMHWGLLAKLDIQEAYSSVQSVQIVIISTIIVFAFVGVMASLGLAKIVSSPIVELKKAAVALGQGNMTARVKKGTILFRDEIADLKDTFNSMANQIASHQMILEHKVRERTLDLARANEGLANKIEERRRVELELEQAKDIAVAANRTKSEFLTNMSHEIRTPLNAIINFTELCLDTQITSEQCEYLSYVCFSAQHLLRLISDILDFSKIEAGKLEMEEIQFSLFDQLEQAVSVQAAPALKNGIELCCRFDDDVPNYLLGDPGRLLQIFVNLIGNAIKFTEKGEVIASVSVKNKSTDSFELLFGVKDTGLAIPKEKQSLLFQAFSQVDSSTQRLYGGTGLGLVISYRLATAMGGHMWMESDGIKGHGSTFWFTARFKVPPSYAVPFSPWENMFKGFYALVVDDNESNRMILIDMLKNWGMIVDGAGTVEDAICALERASQSNKKYNILLLDMWLNGTDASELISFLHTKDTCLEKRFPVESAQLEQKSESLEKPTENVTTQSEVFSCKADASLCTCHTSNGQKPVSVKNMSSISGHGLSSVVMLTSINHVDVSSCLELGLIYHVSKPIKRALLVQVLQSVLGYQDKSAALEEKAPKECQSLPKRLHILVAEDNAVNQRVMVILLKKWGHTAVLANNGEEAVEQAAKDEFDLILMDVQMPVCDGFQATARIRELEKAGKIRRNIPIVAMTAHAMFGDGERCIDAGMNFYVTKPLNAKVLQELLNKIAIIRSSPVEEES